ncbi:hypothetical protein [Xanthomonas euroxanthea]|uniref:HEPN domain-containing protein n=1 Tax=Xanthomonas euroxanthea TaxID=2259622 RepID=A0AA46C4Q2_9XANT|nr:hypothetical protein [Xanthomonas euroxanthea]CAE1132466.1 hypothetical protein XTG_000122 [Xanthomonas euroxanthea]SUZ26370.1 hypothetical protein CPBF424_01240 [Xanthomonas euroxanthea]
MASNIDRYKRDFERLLRDAVLIQQSFSHLCYGKEYEAAVLISRENDKQAVKKYMDALPDFKKAYQSWYSESLVLIKQLLPDRLNDFIRLYEKPKGRRDIGFENYRIEDALQGLRITRYGDEVIADRRSAITHLEQQVAILNSIKGRFDSSLYDIRQLVQADLLDSELDAAKELLKHKFMRAAGAIAGVLLEKHLHEVCIAHNIKLTKKNPTIADLNDALKNSAVIETPQWRFHQHLGDIRNLCDHNKKVEPTADQVNDLIEGVAKVTKTVF